MKYGESILTQLKKKIEKKDIPVRKWPNNAKYQIWMRLEPKRYLEENWIWVRGLTELLKYFTISDGIAYKNWE